MPKGTGSPVDGQRIPGISLESIARQKTLAPAPRLSPTSEPPGSGSRPRRAPTIVGDSLTRASSTASLSPRTAPILGDALIDAAEADADDQNADAQNTFQLGSGAGGEIEELAESLQEKLEEHSRARKRWASLSFLEPSLEADFRELTFRGHLRSFRIVLLSLALFSIALLIYDHLTLCAEKDVHPLQEPWGPNRRRALQEDTNSSSALPLDPVYCGSGTDFALIMRGAQLGLLVHAWAWTVLPQRLPPCLECHPATERILVLVVMVLTSWGWCMFNTIALYQHQVGSDGGPEESSFNFLFLIVMYTVFTPGMPFEIVVFAGWGLMIVMAATNAALWAWVRQDDGNDFANKWGYVLFAESFKELVVNILGTFTTFELISEMRYNFWHANLLKEALMVSRLVRRRMHRLMTNTLPEPILAALGGGDTACVRVYPGTTVLQADMVGFTKLSATHPPQRVLGLLSDIFEDFDRLCETHRVDKVKTIGDAYIVCAGALKEPREDDAARIVRMGVAMQDVVQRKAAAEEIEIAVRVGVHTGRVTGGIIGTVRFHFDMWGTGVNGAVRMEETGEKGRVHISSSTYELLKTYVNCTPNLRREDIPPADVEVGIQGTYWVSPGGADDRGSCDLNDVSASAGARALRALLEGGGGDQPQRGGMRSLLAKPLAASARASASIQGQASGGCATSPVGGAGGGGWRSLWGGGGRKSRPDGSSFGRRGGSGGGLEGASSFGGGGCGSLEGEVLDPDAPPLEITDRASSYHFFTTPRASNPCRGSCECRGSMAAPSPPGYSSAPARRLANFSAEPGARNSAGPAWDLASPRGGRSDAHSFGQGRAGGSIGSPRSTTASTRETAAVELSQAVADELASPRGRKTCESQARASCFSRADYKSRRDGSVGEGRRGGSVPAASQVSVMEDIVETGEGDTVAPTSYTVQMLPSEVIDALRRSAIFLSFLMLMAGGYDFAHWWQHPLIIDQHGSYQTVINLLLCRYLGGMLTSAAIASVLIVLRFSIGGAQYANVALLTFPFFTSMVGYWLAPDASSQYTAFLGLLHIAFGYSTLALSLPLLVLIMIVLSAGYPICQTVMLRFSQGMRLACNNKVYTPEEEYPLIWALVGLGCGQRENDDGVLENGEYDTPDILPFSCASSQLAGRYATKRGFPEPTYCNPPCPEDPTSYCPSNCESYFLEWPCNSMAPNGGSSSSMLMTIFLFVIAHGVGIIYNLNRRSGLRNHAKLLDDTREHIDDIKEEVVRCQQLLENIFAPEVLERLKAKAAVDGEGAGEIIAEEFDECSFLFAKVVGLKSLVDDENQNGEDVVDVLQLVFNRFDQLADLFKVQKVRKTVNEYYMVAAGLPDPTLLEEAGARACACAALAHSMVQMMDIINSDPVVRDLDVSLQLQVGIHSGSAIAGIIGHKRFQYDLCGDAVNTAARMCAYSAPGCITISDTTQSLLGDEYATLSRGVREIKGKGSMHLHYLLARTNPYLKAAEPPKVQPLSALLPPETLEKVEPPPMPSPQKKHAAGRTKHRSKPLERAAGAAPPPSPTREAGESWRGSGGSLASASRRHSQEGDSRRHSQRHSQDGFRLVEGATQARPSDLIRRATGDSLGSGRLHDLHLLEKHSPRDPDGADGSCARVSEESASAASVRRGSRGSSAAQRSAGLPTSSPPHQRKPGQQQGGGQQGGAAGEAAGMEASPTRRRHRRKASRDRAADLARGGIDVRSPSFAVIANPAPPRKHSSRGAAAQGSARQRRTEEEPPLAAVGRRSSRGEWTEELAEQAAVSVAFGSTIGGGGRGIFNQLSREVSLPSLTERASQGEGSSGGSGGGSRRTPSASAGVAPGCWAGEQRSSPPTPVRCSRDAMQPTPARTAADPSASPSAS